MKPGISVIILTYNEEVNIPYALQSVVGWADSIFVVDSYSTDNTVKIARDFGCTVLQNKFLDYAKQRNFAIQNCPLQTEWCFFVDADEWIPNLLKEEISKIILSDTSHNGFNIKWRFIWMGKWIRRGYYPTWVLRMFRAGKARCEERGINEHLVVEGSVGFLENDFIHEDRKGIGEWVSKHNSYASREAKELFNKSSSNGYLDARFFGTQSQRKRWVRFKVWNNLPPLIRPFLYFFYRYVIKAGFLDGKAGFVYHFLQALWYYFLIDVKYLETGKATQNNKQGVD